MVMDMVKIREEQIKDYFKKHKYSTYKEIAKKYNVTIELIRKKFRNQIVSSLNHKCKYIIYIPNHTFDQYNLIKIKGVLFSKFGNIKDTLVQIIKLNDCISSKKLYRIMGFNVRTQISQLTKKRKIFTKNQGNHSLYSLQPLREEVVKEKEFDIASLKQNDKVLRDLQIIKELKELKKTEVANKHNITPETVRNIEERFKKESVKGLIHIRKPKTVKISSSTQAAIITEAIQHPEKTPKEIKESVQQIKSVSLKTIEKTINKVKDYSHSKKNLLLEIK